MFPSGHGLMGHSGNDNRDQQAVSPTEPLSVHSKGKASYARGIDEGQACDTRRFSMFACAGKCLTALGRLHRLCDMNSSSVAQQYLDDGNTTS